MIPAVFGLILAELISVSWIDLKTQKISNKWLLVNILFAIILYLGFRDTYQFHWEIFIVPLGFIVVGFLLFIVNVMGAGDSKYLASLFLLIPSELHFPFFEKILLTTIFVGGIFLIYKIVKNFPQFRAYLVSRYWSGIRSIIKSRISYAPVILLAWMLLGVDLWK